MGRARALLQRDVGYTLHKPTRRRFPTLPVLVFGPDEQWAADLVEVQSLAKDNKGNQYLLSVIDVFSKYAWVEPLKAKTGAAVTQAFEKVLRRALGRTPLKLQTDDGKEFYNKTFRGLITRRGIPHFSTAGDTKASVVERFNRTLKQRLYRYFTVENTLSFVSVLPEIVQGYTRSHHRSRSQRRSRVAEAVRRPRETEATHLQSGRPRAIEQEASHLQEELSAGLDRGSVHGDADEARSRTHVQDRRVGRHRRPRDLLRARFAKGQRGGRRALSRGSHRQTAQR